MTTRTNTLTVAEAERIVLSEFRDWGAENVVFSESLGRVLAQDLVTDCDLPPYDRVTMDGIAIRYAAFEKGIRSFRIQALQAAGDYPVEIHKEDSCVEIMTGAALPSSLDTVIRYEDLEIKEGRAEVKTNSVVRAQHIHFRGSDRRKNEVAVSKKQFITPAIIQMAAALGYAELLVKKPPRIAILSFGDELVEVQEQPSPYQVRRSNLYTMQAVLNVYRLKAELLHLPDQAALIQQRLETCLQSADVLILSGAVSAGRLDYVPMVLEELSVKKLFHQVRQRPGRPFWFGKYENGTVVFAFPGNPVSTFMCMHRYFIWWLKHSWNVAPEKEWAVLADDFTFVPPLQYFLQVKLQTNEKGQWLAHPAAGNGSGDFANLVDANAFMELPMEKTHFAAGEVYPVWRF